MRVHNPVALRVSVTTRRHETHYVGRPTPLGNPQFLSDESERDVVCDFYEEWFARQIVSNSRVRAAVHRIWLDGQGNGGVVRLGCYCAPRRCHADTIARFLRNYKGEFDV